MSNQILCMTSCLVAYNLAVLPVSGGITAVQACIVLQHDMMPFDSIALSSICIIRIVYTCAASCGEMTHFAVSQSDRAISVQKRVCQTAHGHSALERKVCL